MKADLDRISLELARRQLHEKIRYFTPNEGQEQFFAEIFKPGPFIIVNGSGNGGGKTYGLVAFLASACWPGLAPAALKNPLIQNWPFPKRARIVSTPKELEEVGSLQTAINELFPAGRYEANRKGRSYPSQFKTDTGWVIDLFSYEQDKSEMAGPNIGLIMFNEPMPQDLWKEGLARLRKGGLCLVAMTSLLDHPWVVDGILGRSDGDKIRVVYSDVEANCKQHGKNGTLEHDQIEKILGQYDPDEREARKTGKPLSLSGRIFKSFDRKYHVASKPVDVPQGGITHYMAVDPATGKPIAAIWGYIDQSGVLVIHDEYPDSDFEGAKDSNLSVTDYVGIFKRKERNREIAWRIIDRHFANRRQEMGGITLKDEFREAGLHFTDSYSVASVDPEVETGIIKVKDFLRFDPTKNISALNRPKLVISPNCKNLIASMERWGRNPETGKPREEYKDHADCLRYLVGANPEYEAPKDWTSPQRLPFYGVGQTNT